MTLSKYPVHRGAPAPLGATTQKEGINFALFSEHATLVYLHLFSRGADQPFATYTLDPQEHKTGSIWHIHLSNLPQQFEYGYRLEGPSLPGNHYNPEIVVYDPYAKILSTSNHWCASKFTPPPHGIFATLPSFDWEGDLHPNIPMQELIIYEMHVRAFTFDPSSKSLYPGSFLGVIDKIPYLKKLGVNAVELMPVFEFNEAEYDKKNPLTHEQLTNFWGYSTVHFFCPMNRYASSNETGAAIIEFKTMVRELHKAGIEVFLDVVFNHTGEGGKGDPTLCWRGIDNLVYYMVNSDGTYMDFSGCSNTLNCNQRAVSDMIIDSLRYWVMEMHVDGFRFDLASVFTRDPHGVPMADPPVVKHITTDPLLSHVKLIAEAWDAAGLYQVGSFPGYGRWAEWNGKYRDVVRRFIKGSEGEAGAFAGAMCGSQELYGKSGQPYHSINFITAHDGFTLRDLVSYQDKHNEANGEENRDGCNCNESWNCGKEGETKNRSIIALRQQQMRNFQLALLLSIGTPMLLMGDEYGHTRGGNNNPWCQDNALNWFLWDKIEKNPLWRYTSLLIALRKNTPLLKRTTFLSPDEIDWHGKVPFHPDWSPHSRFVSYVLKDNVHANHLLIAFNAHFEPTRIELPPPPPHKHWHRIIDTSLPSPQDIIDDPSKQPLLKATYDMPPHSALLARAR